MPLKYPRKIRARTMRGKWVLEELVPSAGGAYYVKTRVETGQSNIFEVLASSKWLPQVLHPELEVPAA